MPEVLTWGVDAVICALGTTSGKAGSKEVFRQVDYVLPLAFAKLAHQQGAETFALVSAIGADANSSFFYPKTKGEVERDMKLVRGDYVQAGIAIFPPILMSCDDHFERARRTGWILNRRDHMRGRQE